MTYPLSRASAPLPRPQAVEGPPAATPRFLEVLMGDLAFVGRETTAILRNGQGVTGVIVDVGLLWLTLRLADAGTARVRRSQVALLAVAPMKGGRQ